MTGPGRPERPRDEFGRPLAWGTRSQIPFEDYAANTVDRNLELGIRHFGAGLYFCAHEAWEEAWRQLRGTPAEATAKGLAQLGAGFVHVQRGNSVGAETLLGRALSRLENEAPMPVVESFLGAAKGLALAQLNEARSAKKEGRAPTLITEKAVTKRV